MKTTAAFSLLLSAAGLASAYTPVPWYDPARNTNPPIRYDIDNLQSQDPEQFDLFMLGLQRWMTTSASQTGGYFQVAGIHGAPHQYWDPTNNAGGYQRTGEGSWYAGYCFHDEQNFYLWHRPYLALFEQRIAATAKGIADSWSTSGGQRARYQAAVARIRLPYWDWAKTVNGQTGRVSTFLTANTVSVGNPTNGGKQTINNPLRGYTLVSDGNLGRYSNGASITLGGGSGGRSTWRSGSYTSDMINQGPSLRRWVGQLLNTPNVCWNVFATYDSGQHNVCRNQPAIQSLEGIHNTIHNTVAGSMANLDIAAFDPIFWLHHCNVDRIGALWQALNPNTKVVRTVSSSGTWISNAGVPRDETYNLMPFRWRDTNRDWWQPRWLYDVRATGYTYTELRGNPSIAQVQAKVNALYGNGRTQSIVSASRKLRVRRADRAALLEYRAAASAAGANLTVAPPTAALAPIAGSLIKSNGSFDEYTVKVSIKKSVTAGKSFNFHLFFGNPGKASTHGGYLAQPNRIGGFAIAIAGAMDPAKNGGNMKMEQLVDGYVPITDALLNLVLIGNIKDMKPATVRKYCAAKLTWRLVTTDGEDIGGKGRRHGLRVRIQHQVVTPDGSDSQPVVPPPEQLVDTTNSTTAKALPSGVAATTLTADPTGSAGAIGPVPLPTTTTTP